MIAEKAQLVVNDMAGGVTPAAGSVLSGLLPVLIQIITGLLGSGGLGTCLGGTTPTGAAVRRYLARPKPRHRRIMAATVAYYIEDPTLAASAQESLLAVGRQLSDADALSMYQEANPGS